MIAETPKGADIHGAQNLTITLDYSNSPEHTIVETAQHMPAYSTHVPQDLPHTLQYTAITTPMMDHHNYQQEQFHQGPAYVRQAQLNEGCRVEIAAATMGLHLEQPLRSQVTQNSVKMTPKERFEASDPYPYQQHNAYQPVPMPSQTAGVRSPPMRRYASASSTRATCTSEANHTYGDQDPVYWTQPAPYSFPSTVAGQDISEWGQDLAGVGTVFDLRIQSPDAYYPYPNGGYSTCSSGPSSNSDARANSEW
ncbi:hypothetical protein G7Y89_g8646 [Cudoniella acicularis]|uniref:Uncharacterized protein n=1 Tax=Cudoniella acicularis TaxID=354080 RepID=A0A8H4RJ00_9HELO|nr:hypothetical protein G7Y89_g8646 [Cudoniella acicularis]